MSLQATPFHARAVEANRFNVWENRRGYTLARYYENAAEEALVARFGAVMGDLSWHWRAEFSGGDVEAFVARAFTRNGARLAENEACEVLWLNDGGAVRGRGILLRLARDRFLLSAAEEDRDWLFFAAGLYGVCARDHTSDGVLALIGPYAEEILLAAELSNIPAPMMLRRQSWRGLEIAISRLGIGFEIWCEADIALIVWDRLQAAGAPFALLPAGQEALDTLSFECGLLLPGRDFAPARDGFVAEPSLTALGLFGLVDAGAHYNGKTGAPARGLCGLVLDGPAEPGPVTFAGRSLGQLLACRYSPALQAVIGLAVLEPGEIPQGLSIGHLSCRAVALPFLPLSEPILGFSGAATETAASTV
ncbi:glycine cleavage system aminomethyltransferase T [Rhizomicrobium palustre]|uniref:Glycine cleavage system aminomethyltransferase T n=1 Tax=Rhizomicrobium palustre TaxID=189966 RepID=A0A846MZW8_9PROT|nr:aminomethyl transferase family protein [Rhizomicrobium palustre]NIK88853.1 glycine cleavage system aminomethyltransferase T [Rhizomicrobium palustre]